jgi:ABC-type phosphate/phosphonate transport system substrate-binding protein
MNSYKRVVLAEGVTRRVFLGTVGTTGFALAAGGLISGETTTPAEKRVRSNAKGTGSNEITLSYYPWITQSISGQPLADAIHGFAQILEAAISAEVGNQISVTVLPEIEIPQQIADIRAEPLSPVLGKIALMNPVGYALTHEQVVAVKAVVVVRRRIGPSPPGPTYKAQIYTNSSTGINSLTELRKRSFAFGSPQSTSNFLVPAHMLWVSGVHPINAFSRLEFAGGHDLAAKAVYEGRVEAGAGHDGVIADLAAKPGYSGATTRLKRLAWSEDIPSDPIAIHTASSEIAAAIQRALLAVAKSNDSGSAGNQAVKKFWGTDEGFQSTNEDSYRSLLPYLKDLSLRPDDLLHKW